MKKLFIFLLILLVSNCSTKKLENNHGLVNLDKKKDEIIVGKTNKNDILNLFGPASTVSTFEDDIYIYIERKTSSSRLTKLGKKVLLVNNVLILDINNRGILVKKEFFNKNDMNKLNFDKAETKADHSKKSFVYNFFYTLRQRIDDPRGIKRTKN